MKKGIFFILILSSLFCYEQIRIESLKNIAQKGNSEAQYLLGICYLKGTEVEKSSEKAVFWFKKSSEQGNVIAQTNIAECYYYGKGVKKDISKAILWLRKACEKGNKYSCDMLIKMKTI